MTTDINQTVPLTVRMLGPKINPELTQQYKAEFGDRNRQNALGLDDNTMAKFRANEYFQDKQNKYNREMWELSNKENERLMDKANAYNERMANTHYQRVIEDIKKAGLNPMLMFGNGLSGNSGPSSAQFSTQAQKSAESGGVDTPDYRKTLTAQNDNNFFKMIGVAAGLAIAFAKFL